MGVPFLALNKPDYRSVSCKQHSRVFRYNRGTLPCPTLP